MMDLSEFNARESARADKLKKRLDGLRTGLPEDIRTVVREEVSRLLEGKKLVDDEVEEEEEEEEQEEEKEEKEEEEEEETEEPEASGGPSGTESEEPEASGGPGGSESDE